ncbi:MAG: glycoside hydrolase family 3 C-terminal domain-containing protein [Lachnospiraceae bacterium]|nr:glycoside hydrolase family 3 C-terminal domain-containing protein [Lachnospiraceae bacterium]
MSYQDTPLWDETLDIEERLDYLIGELTIEEKLNMLGTWSPEIERLGICRKMTLGGEAAHGVEARHDQASNSDRGGVNTTAFTQPIGLSATFDTDLIKEVGKAVGYEARALFNQGDLGLSRWAPTVDMGRDPRWGRNEEGYGEDPYLTGKMASAYIQGMKGDHPFYVLTASTLKHFYANNIEKGRARISSDIDARNKLEYYLEPFRRCIVEGGAQGVMTAYNEINGIPCNVNDEVNEYLRDELGFEGHVVTDAADFSQTVDAHHYTENLPEALVMSLKAGVDVMTDEAPVVYKAAKEAYEKGILTEEMIDKSIRHTYGTRIRLGMFDAYGTTPYAGIKPDVIDCSRHRKLARKTQQKACVLVKNEDNFFPMKTSGKKLAVIGPWADAWHNDWYGALAPYKSTIYQALSEVYDKDCLSYDDGLDRIVIGCTGGYVKVSNDNKVVITADRAEATVFSVNDWGWGRVHLRSENGLLLRTEDRAFEVKNKDAFDWFVREDFDLRKRPDGRYEIHTWNGNQVCVKDGELTNVGDAPASTVKRVPMEGNWQSSDETFIFDIEVVENGAERAAGLAKKADMVLVVLGSNPVVNSKECIDRDSLDFIESQSKLLKAVAKANTEIGLVLVTNYPYYIEDELDCVKAAVITASGSQELGHGTVDVLTGVVSPAGRINQTWYSKKYPLPDFNNYDIRKTKRTYMYNEEEVIFPFGYGLSYTNFVYRKMKFNSKEGQPVFTVEVENAGNYPSDEVIQLYVSASGLRVEQPIRRMVGFKRLHFAPGEKKVVSFTVPKDELSYYDVVKEKLIVETGIYEFSAGGSSEGLKESALCAINGVECGERNAYLTINAHRYDEYENCATSHTKDKQRYLRSCTDESYDLEYRDITYEEAPKSVEVKYVCAANCFRTSRTECDSRSMEFKLYFAEDLLIDTELEFKGGADEILTAIIPIDHLGMVGMENINHTVRLECGPGIGLISFVFKH